MALMWHILKKDLRRLRWLLIAWIALLTLGAIANGRGPFSSVDGDALRLLNTFVEFTRLVTVLWPVPIVGLLVHDDPLAGSDAFWLTRPIPRRTLFWSKLWLLVMGVAVPSLIADEVLMATFHVSARTLWLAAPELLLTSVAALALLFLAAAVTRRSWHFLVVLAVVATISGVVLQSLGVLRQIIAEQYPRPAAADETALFVGFALFIAGVLFAVRYHYARRQPEKATALAAAALLVAVMIGSSWPAGWQVFREPQVDEPWARDPTLTKLTFAPDPPRIFSTYDDTWGTFYYSVALPVALEGVPPSYAIDPITAETSFRLDNGDVVRGLRRSGMYTYIARSSPQRGLRTRGWSVDAGTAPARWEELWPVLLYLSPRDFARVDGRTGTYRGTLEYALRRYDDLGARPVRPGLVYAHGGESLAVLGTRQLDRGCLVAVRTTETVFAVDRMLRATVHHSFRRRGSGELLNSDEYRDTSEFSPLRIAGFGPARLRIRYDIVVLDKPDTGSRDTWQAPTCDEIDIVVERSQYAGRVVRTLDIPRLRIAGDYFLIKLPVSVPTSR